MGLAKMAAKEARRVRSIQTKSPWLKNKYLMKFFFFVLTDWLYFKKFNNILVDQILLMNSFSISEKPIYSDYSI